MIIAQNHITSLVKYLSGRKFVYLLLLLFIHGFFNSTMATHNRAGEITYKNLGNLTYEIKIITYTFTLSEADRPELGISWGDGMVDTIPRVGETYLENDIKRNEYRAIHKYAAPAKYIISFEDPNRNGGVVNIPNSINVPFYVESMLEVNPFLGNNTSPQLLNPPIDRGCIGQPFIHNPAAYDPDGDSLVYRLINCKGESGKDIIGYKHPIAKVNFSVNPQTGDLYWDSPTLQGEFNVAMKIEEYRKGILIGYIIRDMQIEIVPCDNNKPLMQVNEPYCVEAGKAVQFNVKATDPDNDKMILTAYGGPISEVPNKADFDQPIYGNGEINALFYWKTQCDNVRYMPYNVVFKVRDQDVFADLVEMKSVGIQVVAPAPENLNAVLYKEGIKLSWNEYICNNAQEIHIYRKIGGFPIVKEPCITGIPDNSGYQKIAELSNVDLTDYYDDNNGNGLIIGNEYCYRIVAYFEDGSESYASEEVCNQLLDNKPVLTNVSILKTDNENGKVYLAWSKPDEMDTVLYPPPYFYQVQRFDSSKTTYLNIDTLKNINDTTYIDSLVNTVDKSLLYRVGLFSGNETNSHLAGYAYPAFSIFLKADAFDREIKLSWTNMVPWINTKYVIYRKNIDSEIYDSIGITDKLTFIDNGLKNKQQYCYFIKSIGSYNTSGFVNPIINYSQQTCIYLNDIIPPCSPSVQGKADCEKMINIINWDTERSKCMEDIAYYTLYYKPDFNSAYQVIAQNLTIDTKEFVHERNDNIVGCYQLKATDSAGNESLENKELCFEIDSCQLFQLPNVFTPNGDNWNDLYMSLPYEYVDKIEMNIYNRWGGLVFKTNDPKIKWDGKNYLTKKDCSEGVYYYVCDVYEKSLNGFRKRILSGYIQILK